MERVSWWRGVVLMIVLARVVSADPDPVSLAVFPFYVLSSIDGSATVRLRWTIERDDRNRFWMLAWSNEESNISGSSFGQLDGAASPRSYERILTVRRGETVFRLCLSRDDSASFCAKAHVETR